MHLTQVSIVEGGVSIPYSGKIPPNEQPREYLRQLVTMLNSPQRAEKLKSTYGIDASKVTSATLTFAQT